MRFLKRNKTAALLMAIFITSGALSGCSLYQPDSEADSGEPAVRPVIEMTREDRRTTSDSAKEIALGAAGEELLITDGGDYRLSGEMNGCIHVNAEEQIVHLFLNGVNVRSVTAPAIYVESAGKVILTLLPDTENTLSDGSKYISDVCDGCIFSMCDLTVNGSGSLSVSGYYKDAIHTKDYLRISGVKLFARAKDDALHGNDGVLISEADISAEAEKCGIRTTKSGKLRKGNIEITGSTLSVIAGEHALNASRSIYMVSSKAFLKGVMSNSKADHDIFIEEGCLTNG
ncbi:MAG: carbohydrate-binding domain-containing protein [Clostridia bacterium]|nr:carbohydrate-binding domain-containing protein [Clostridia bacterium]